MNILVIHATAGAGHKKAAEAIFNGLKAGGFKAQLVDALDFTNPFFKYTYPRAYSLMVTKFSWAWGFFFALLDLPWVQPLVRAVRRIYNGLNAGGLQRLMIEGQFDCIITTQFLSAEVSAYLKRSGKIKSKVICVVTDFDVHRIWVNEGIDLYTGACPFTKEKLVRLGVPENRVFVTGIPTGREFSQVMDVAGLKAKFGLRDGLMTILVATGSFGMGPIEELIESLKDYQLLVVCGHNKHLYERLQSKAGGTVHIFALVNNMHELMSVADVMITKPGGLSIAEALVKNLPMLFFSAIPGQETHNVMVLQKYGACLPELKVEDIPARILFWNNSPPELQRLRQQLAGLAKPGAVDDILRLI